MKTLEKTRAAIISLHGVGLSNGEIARRLDVSKHTIARWIQRHKITGNILHNRGAGRPRCTTPNQDRAIADIVDNSPFTAATAIHQQLGLTCTARQFETAIRPVASTAVYQLKSRSSPKLTWNDVWSLPWNTQTNLLSIGTSYIVMRKHILLMKQYDRSHVVGNRRSGRITAGCFGWIHSSGVGELTDVGPSRFTGATYVEILEDVLLPPVQQLLYPDDVQFFLVQDNSPIHTSNVAKMRFQKHPFITLVPHPPRSPDLNPIENVWAELVRCHIHDCHYRTREQLLSLVTRAWEYMRTPAGQTFVETVCASMTHR
ncbi:hypothetical protein Pcinc_003240 [Petrolisthes cinctipes]|uniref:Tc1-like transposase DDE domain-containing protein n=1 Tax=Petrolisthes cinctipes TaxID=88211 RepID=A0AAE1GH29_PETCI|nr:hypothetical protein Pcinc_003240 [Petrolisthes cinctipes]